MYYLFLDESGVEGLSDFITLGGIIVDDMSRQAFNNEYSRIISTYFNFPLPKNFKLHYEELRNAHLRKSDSVYKRVANQRKEISDEMFNAINTIDCNLLSVSINIENHRTKYNKPVNIHGYALYLLLERFQYFLDNNSQNGKIIYERYNNRLRHKVHNVHVYFKSNRNFPNYTTFKNIVGTIENGNPLTEPLLSFADFFVYAPWIKCESCCMKCCRYNEIKHKYFNLDHFAPRLRGNYEI
jgi:hypothetical protein